MTGKRKEARTLNGRMGIQTNEGEERNEWEEAGKLCRKKMLYKSKRIVWKARVKMMKYMKRTNGINKSNKQGNKKRRSTGRRRRRRIMRKINNNRRGISKYEADEGKN